MAGCGTAAPSVTRMDRRAVSRLCGLARGTRRVGMDFVHIYDRYWWRSLKPLTFLEDGTQI